MSPHGLCKTKTKSNTTDPVWNEVFSFYLDPTLTKLSAKSKLIERFLLKLRRPLRHCITKYRSFFCQFLSVVGVLDKRLSPCFEVMPPVDPTLTYGLVKSKVEE